MEGNGFVFDSINEMYYKCQWKGLNRSRSYIDSPDWIKRKKATLNPQNNDGKCFQYAVTVALNHEGIVKDLQRISKFKPFANNYISIVGRK